VCKGSCFHPVQKILGSFILTFWGIPALLLAQPEGLSDLYRKVDTLIPMRDGKKLYTVIYLPRDESKRYPILMERTPYSAGPYGPDRFPSRLGPNPGLAREQYIFVRQDVRGRYMSEGHNLEVTPHRPGKKTRDEVDESSDTYDTIEFLLRMIRNHNGKVGIYGISYPGFYASAALPDAHPALAAVSPQAPVTDEFIGDDVNHNGAFFLMDNFNFINSFGVPRSGPLMNYPGSLTDTAYSDAYRFFLELGPPGRTRDPSLFGHKSYIWNEYLEHDTYDEYWRSRNIRQHLKGIHVPTLVVGGWYDAEDCFGALRTYDALEKQNSGNANTLVMGPWTHGAWASGNWTSFGPYAFGMNTSTFFQDSIETPFFNYYLKGIGSAPAFEAVVFETGSNLWKTYEQWPPRQSKELTYYLSPRAGLGDSPAPKAKAYSSYISDPSHPVPYTAKKQRYRNNLYMVEDQRFVSDRPDVLSFTTGPLEDELILCGPVEAEIYASTSGSDLDLIVKVIDAHPDSGTVDGTGAQYLVRAEVFRGKFRKSYSSPSPFHKNKPEVIRFTLPDVNHCFKKGHRLMIQIQSSWFPLVDRNPHQFLKIPEAGPGDYQSAEIRIYHDRKRPSSIRFNSLIP